MYLLHNAKAGEIIFIWSYDGPGVDFLGHIPGWWNEHFLSKPFSFFTSNLKRQKLGCQTIGKPGGLVGFSIQARVPANIYEDKNLRSIH